MRADRSLAGGQLKLILIGVQVQFQCSILIKVQKGSVVRLFDTPDDGEQNRPKGGQHQLIVNLVVKDRDRD